MKQKLISLALSVIMIATMCVPAFAASTGAVSEDMIQREIAAKTDEMVASVYEQFVQQNAVDLIDVYREVISSHVEYEVRMKYGANTATERAGISPYARYRLTNGGIVSYETTDTTVPDNTQHFDIAITYLDRQRAYDLVLEECSFNVSSIITTALGYLPRIGGILTAIFYIDSSINSAKISEIATCDGYAMVTNIICEETGGESSVVNGWSAHPFATTPSFAENVNVIYFDEYEG